MRLIVFQNVHEYADEIPLRSSGCLTAHPSIKRNQAVRFLQSEVRRTEPLAMNEHLGEQNKMEERLFCLFIYLFASESIHES